MSIYCEYFEFKWLKGKEKNSSHMKVANKCLNVREQVEVVEWNKKIVPSLPLLSCESSVSVKQNPDRKKKERKKLLKNRLSLSTQDFFLSSQRER